MAKNRTGGRGVALYMHAGSGNHGCEAIADSLLRMMGSRAEHAAADGAATADTMSAADTTVPSGAAFFDGAPVRLVSCHPEEDRRYLPAGLVVPETERRIDLHPVWHTLYYGYRKLTGDAESFARFRFRALTGTGAPRLAVSIGGDNYCYPILLKDLMLANRMLNRQGTATMLLGCSVEPSLLREHPEVVEDMKRYRRIVARESLTYRALREAGVPEARLALWPDPAFALPVREEPLPEGFLPGRTVGVNVSPMAVGFERQAGVTMESYEALLAHILADTPFSAVLIPHVVWASNDDRGPLRALYEKFRGSGRVVMADDAPAEVLKGVIGRCRLFIGARTHATIAAYSQGVPTLVVGYSVKARGIAQDIFGTQERYVLPVQELQESGALAAGFDWLLDNEEKIRAQLAQAMPQYRKKALQNGEEIRRLYAALTAAV